MIDEWFKFPYSQWFASLFKIAPNKIIKSYVFQISQKIWLRYNLTISDLVSPQGESFYPAWTAVNKYQDFSLVLNITPVPVDAFPIFSCFPHWDCFCQVRPVRITILTITNKIFNVFGNARPSYCHSNWCLSCLLCRMCLVRLCQNQVSFFGRS